MTLDPNPGSPGAPSRRLPDGRRLTLEPTMFGARLCVGRAVDDGTFDEEYMYSDGYAYARAARAFQEWDGTGEPAGWYRHKPSNRRRPDGDPAREFVRE